MTAHIDTVNEMLWQSVRLNDLEGAEEWLKRGAGLHVAELDGETILHLAARTGSNLMVQLLLGAGADPNRPDAHGVTPFGAAVNAHMYANAATMLDAGADVNFQAAPDKMTPLIHAICCDALEIAHGGEGTRRTDFLLRYGADPDRRQVVGEKSYSAADIALHRDDDIGRVVFAPLFRSYLSRDIRDEYNREALAQKGRAKVRAAIDAATGGGRAKFKLGGGR